MKKQYTKLTLSITVIAICVNSCSKKTDLSDTETVTKRAVGAVPSSFTQKVMVEESTGTWCGWCVMGAEGTKTAREAYPVRVNAVALHGGSNEPMLVPEYNLLNSFAGVMDAPNYQLNRGTGGGFPGVFASNVATALLKSAACGLAIDARASSGNNVTFTVYAGFNSNLTDDYRLMVYLVEDSVHSTATSYDQQNFINGYATYSSSYYFTQPKVINNFMHRFVARKLLSASIKEGDIIPEQNVGAGSEYVKTYTYTINNNDWKAANIYVVAGIMEYDALCANQVILNSQTVRLGFVKNWD